MSATAADAVEGHVGSRESGWLDSSNNFAPWAFAEIDYKRTPRFRERNGDRLPQEAQFARVVVGDPITKLIDAVIK